ncbi:MULTISPECIES: hypothetical protein [Rhizobium]|uniref:hypothetical protein n=1 Tax=Rhizobium TaxID=379 RepID=UPI000A209298|nr:MULTISPECIES: hypothetical protein [Rhizobium]ARO28855.1 hypothetical protein NXC14_CH00859 [Rhizobium sp. NXC14]MBX5140696.1 hypothetical protein [Rhizobium lentis]MDK4735034.1 hypothetical protein [Rhizobium sp. CNPSo 3490]PDT31362.1 hypothetical protein CO660_04965 [Rhizobium sp. L9]
MRTLALMTMVLGWLVYSAMSAWAGCPTCASMNGPAAPKSATMDHAMAGMDMSGATGKAQALKDPCAAGRAAQMPLCAACLLLPPAAMTAAGVKPVFAYPAPALARVLDDDRPAPLAPPPRMF